MTDRTISILINSGEDFWTRMKDYANCPNTKLLRVNLSLVTDEAVLPQNVEPDTIQRRLEICEQADFSFAKNFDAVVRRETDQSEVTFSFLLAEYNGIAVPVKFNPTKLRATDLAELKNHFVVVTDSKAKLLSGERANDIQLNMFTDAISALLQTSASLSKTQATSIKKSREFLDAATVENASEFNKLRVEFEEYKKGELEKIETDRADVTKARMSLKLEENRTARRNIQDSTDQLIARQEKFARSVETVTSDRAVRTASYLVGAVGVCILISTLSMLRGGVIAGSSFYAPFATGSLLVASTALVLIRHEMSRSRTNAETDFAIMQYSRDMYRMSWIAELIFEAQTAIGDKEVEIPPAVLEQFSRSLFERTLEGKSAHPLDEISRLMKKFKKASVTSTGISVERGDAKSKPKPEEDA